MAVAIITDTAASLPADLAAERDIDVLPMWLTVGGEPHREDEPGFEEAAGADASTSGPTPGEFAEAIAAGLERCEDGVVVLTIAAAMSSTHQAAVMAAHEVDGPVRVVDTETAAGAEGLVVLAAAEAAASGATLDEVVDVAGRVIERVRLVATLPTLDYLVRSGRVPNVAGWAGRRLGINPLFEFRQGKIRRLLPARNQPAALDRIVSAWRRSRVDGARLHVAALHALAPETATDLLGQVEAEESPATSFVGEFGSVMVIHTGPGIAGLAWWWDDG